MDKCNREDDHGKKKRRKYMSKAERLAKKSSIEHLSEEERLQRIKLLVESSKSEDWDNANRLVVSNATQVAFLSGLLTKEQGRASAHFMKRWNPSPLNNLSKLLEFPALLGVLHLHPSSTASFLNTCADASISLESLYFILHNFVLPWITDEKDAPLQILLHDFTALKWLLVEHALATGQGRHLINQFAHVCRDLHGQALNPWWTRELQESSDAKREQIRQSIENVLRRAWPDAVVHLFGSSMTKLCQPNDDVDLCVLVPSCPVRGADSIDLIVDMNGHLALYFPSESVVVRNARIPLIKLHDPVNNLGVDLCVNNTAALWNSALICAFLRLFPPLEALCQSVREWAKARALVGSSHLLSSYSMVLLVIYFLQSRDLLPFVDVDFDDSIDVTEAAIHAAVARAIDEAHFIPKEVPSLPVLLLDFFIFWATDFSYSTEIASLRRRNLPKEKTTPLLHLEDPIETKRNLGSYLNRDTQRVLRNEMIRVCMLVQQSHQQPPRNLLLHSLSYEQLGVETSYSPDEIVSCLLRQRSPHSHWFTMTGDLVFRERENVVISLITIEAQGRFAIDLALKHKVVGLDCEGISLGRSGKICLISLALGCVVYLFDILESPSLAMILKPLLEDTSVLKVMHDCRKDSDALFHQFGITLTNVFDTQAAHAIVQSQRIKKVKEGMKCLQVSKDFVVPLGNAKHECISFGDMLWQYFSIHESDKHEVKTTMTATTWTTRPLTQQLQHYAAVDVIYLPVLYRVLDRNLMNESRSRLQERVERYLACREWTFSMSSSVQIGQRVPGYLNNITAKAIYVNISPSLVATIPVENTVAEPGTLKEKHIGEAIEVQITSQNESQIAARFIDSQHD
ncbi:hypothetical protein AeMF1_005260 [Aphanomyces euteiches]|nr:hypothetical protein AeMF1_005260 [Aphanomyces euteiches]KAH9189647.1 hypothetical protein AeNC1_008385 [Aphanomyces euteiches]